MVNHAGIHARSKQRRRQQAMARSTLEQLQKELDIEFDNSYEHYWNYNHYSRFFPSELPLFSAGYIQNKASAIRNTFTAGDRVAFIFILDGSGFLAVNGQKYIFSAPAAFTCRADEIHDFWFGPGAGGWREFWLQYFGESVIGKLMHRHLLGPQGKVWKLGDPQMAEQIIQRIITISNNQALESSVDMIDRLAEMLIVASRLPQSNPASSLETAISQIRHHVDEHCEKDIDFTKLAMEHGMSLQNFRLQWAKQMKYPPAHYLMRARIFKACKILIDSDEKIAATARLVHFADPRHFVRRFKQVVGKTPSEFRHFYRDYQTNRPNRPDCE